MLGILLLSLFNDIIYTSHVHGSQTGEPEKYSPPEHNLLNSGIPVKRIYVTTKEEIPPGSLLIDLTKHQELKPFHIFGEDGKLTTLEGGAVRYRLLNVFDAKLFRIGPTSGRITIATRLDREALCASQMAQFCCNARAKIPVNLEPTTGFHDDSELPISHMCHLVLHISLQTESEQRYHQEYESGGKAVLNRLALIYLYIRLDDINDHTPQFASHANNLNVAEDTPIGSLLHYFRISDPDSGSNSLKEVKLDVKPLITSESRIPSRKGGDEQNMVITNQPFEARLTRDGVSLLLIKALDREVITAYDITLTAIDGDKVRALSSRISLRVHVTDVNDNPPVWVLQRLTSSNVPNYIGNFKSEIDRYGQPDFHLLDTEPIQFNVSIPEDTQVGALVYWLKAADADLGDNGRLQYAIDTSAPGGMSSVDYFTIQSTTGEVRLRAQLDYEYISAQLPGPVIEIPVVVKDSPRTGRQLSTRAIMRVLITDVNDMPPTITASPLVPQSFPTFSQTMNSDLGDSVGGNSQNKVSFYVWENQSPGQPVASILVSDPDTGEGGRVTCSLKNDYFQLIIESGDAKSADTMLVFPESHRPNSIKYDFEIPELLSSPVTYQLVSTQRLDREINSRHSVILTCRDHGSPRPLFSTRRLDIEVLDENDNSPIFSGPLINLSVTENLPPGQIIGYLNATDRDIWANAQLRYWVGENDASWVGLHSQTGEVRINTIFDRETETERRFTAYVVDSRGLAAHTASTVVNVKILDENDHTPRFTELYYFSVPENSPPGTEVGTIHAVDEDEGDNGKVRYLLKQPSREFELDSDTGLLTVRQSRLDSIGSSYTMDLSGINEPLDREQQDVYELTVTAEDSGSPPRRTTTMVHISISDVNDHAPQFRYPSPSGVGSVLNMSCNQPGNPILAKVHANDSDAGRNGEIEYSILRPSRTIKRQKTTQMINKTINSDTDNAPSAFQYNMTTHGSVKQKQNSLSLEQNSLGSNDSTGKMNSSGTKQNPSKYTNLSVLQGGPTPEHFDIDSYSGHLFIIHPILDCSKPSNMRLVILATDGGEPRRTSTATLNIHIHPTHHQGTPVFSNPKVKDNSLDSRTDDILNLGKAPYSVGQTFRVDAQRGNQRPPGTDRRESKNHQPMAPVSHLLSGTSHWSAIVGLVVAMVILVILLCIMLIVLRHRIGIDNRKNIRRDHRNNNENSKSLGKMGVNHTSVDGLPEVYFKGSNGSHSLHNLRPDDELHRSSVTLSPTPSSPPTLGARYFCTLPPQGTNSLCASGMLGTTVNLNSGEIALLQHNNTISTHSGNQSSRDSNRLIEEQQSPQRVIYRMANGDLYGYIPAMDNKRASVRQAGQQGYQTLQPIKQQATSANHHPLFVLSSPSKDIATSTTFGVRCDTEKRSKGVSHLYQIGDSDTNCRWVPNGNHYTPLLLETTLEDHERCGLVDNSKQSRSSPPSCSPVSNNPWLNCVDSSTANRDSLDQVTNSPSQAKMNDILSTEQLHTEAEKSNCVRPFLNNLKVSDQELQLKNATKRIPHWTAGQSVVDSINPLNADSTASFV